MSLAAVQSGLGKLNIAMETLEQARQLDPANEKVLINTGVMAAMQGDMVEARQWFQQALAHHPASKDARDFLKRLDFDP